MDNLTGISIANIALIFHTLQLHKIPHFMFFLCVQISLHMWVLAQILFWYFLDVVPHDIFESVEQDLYFKVVAALFNGSKQ